MNKHSGLVLVIIDLRNKYDMTLLMSLLIATTVTKQKSVFEEELEKLIEKIIEEEYFEDKNINHKTDYKLAAQFDLSHIHGITKKSKAKNTVLEKDQVIPLKRVNRLNSDTGKYEKIPGPDNNPGQEKMLAKKHIKMKGEDGKEFRPMMSVNIPSDDDSVEDNVSVGIISDDEELDANDFKVSLISGLDESIDNDFERKCSEWKNDQSKEDSYDWILDQPKPDVQIKKVIPEHFDSQSVISLSKETFQTKKNKNKYKYAESASTKYTETYLEEETPSDLVCRNTTLFLMACKANKWNIVMALLKLNPEKYPSLFKKCGKKHSLYDLDEHKTNPLILALQSEQIDICKIMIEKVDAETLKKETVTEKKTAMKYVTEEMTGSNSQKLLIDCIEAKIGKNKNKKNQSKSVKKKGSSCGFMFQSLDPVNWKCMKCNVIVRTNADGHISSDNNNHYQNHYQR